MDRASASGAEGQAFESLIVRCFYKAFQILTWKAFLLPFQCEFRVIDV